VKSKITKGVASFLIICIVVFFAALHSWLIPLKDTDIPEGTEKDFKDYTYNLETFQILSIEISYEAEIENNFTYRFYKIERFHNTYYNNTGEEVDSQLIFSLVESFTDFYESEYQYSYDRFFTADFRPHFAILLTFSDGKNMIMKSDSSYYCFIPWNITYNGKSYVQYNGKIPSALLQILVEVDKEQWSPYDKLARLGCYSALVPPNLQDFSFDFPQTEAVVMPEEEQGKAHLMWHTTFGDSIMGSPGYWNGIVYVTVPDKLVSLDVKTGERLWEVEFENREDSPLLYAEDVLVHEGVIYVGAPDSRVYAVDCETGTVLWKYKTFTTHYFSVKVVGRTLVALTGGITCLERKTGELIWEIPEDTWNEKFCEDKILFAGLGADESSYWFLLDIDSGEILWQENLSQVQHPVYRNEILYFFNSEGALTSIDLEKVIENQLYWPENHVRHLEVFGDRILLVIRDEGNVNRLVLLNTEGLRIWEHTYSEKTASEYGCLLHFEVCKDRIFVARGGGIIEAFGQDGEKMWENEVRGTCITSFSVYENRIYVSANDGTIYCLTTVGDMLWFFVTENEADVFPEEAQVYVIIEDGLILVATSRGVLYVFSV
jgi:outer membrane protein assembly factor BamB